MRSLLAATTAAVLVLTLAAAPSAPAAAGAPGTDGAVARAVPAPRPTLAALPARSQAGRTVVLKGTAGAGVVRLQRRYGDGRWTAVARTRATPRGTYRVAVRLTRGGPTSFRAVSAGRASGPRSLAVYQWIDVATQSVHVDGPAVVDTTVSIGGRAFVRSIEAGENARQAEVSLSRCVRAEVWGGFRDEDRADLAGTESLLLRLTALRGGRLLREQELTIDVGPAQRVSIPFAGADRLSLGVKPYDGEEQPTIGSALGRPRVLCNAASLPDAGPPSSPSPVRAG